MAVENATPEANSANVRPRKSPLDVLMPALHRLDHMLERAVAAAESAYGTKAARDPYRGLYITRDDAERLLVREAGAPFLLARNEADRLPDCPPLAWLQQTFGLSPFDLDVILIVLAPEVDLRYERLYAYLQDDVSRRRPSVDLALNLLCSTIEAKLQARTRFASDAPLIHDRLLHLLPDGSVGRPVLLSQYLQLDEALVPLLIGQPSVDSRIASYVRLSKPQTALDSVPLPETLRKALAVLVAQAKASSHPAHFYIHGSRGLGQEVVAAGVATEIGRPLLSADLSQAAQIGADFANSVRLLFRQARLLGAVLYLHGVDSLRSDDRAALLRDLTEQLAENSGVVLLAGERPWSVARLPGGSGPVEVVTLRMTAPDFSGRRQSWKDRLEAAGNTIPDTELDALASRFRLTPEQIADAVTTAKGQAKLRALASAGDGSPAIDDLFAAARGQSTHDLGTLARKIEPNYCWDDIVLPEDQQRHLGEICNQARYRPSTARSVSFAGALCTPRSLSTRA